MLVISNCVKMDSKQEKENKIGKCEVCGYYTIYLLGVKFCPHCFKERFLKNKK